MQQLHSYFASHFLHTFCELKDKDVRCHACWHASILAEQLASFRGWVAVSMTSKRFIQQGALPCSQMKIDEEISPMHLYPTCTPQDAGVLQKPRKTSSCLVLRLRLRLVVWPGLTTVKSGQTKSIFLGTTMIPR